MFKLLKGLFNKKNITIFHEFHRPPYGGGNQFLLALKKEFEKSGYPISTNRIGFFTKACLFNSFNFDFEKLYTIKKKHPKLRMIHRVDGPIGVYRGFDDGTDDKIWQANHDIADCTIFQSNYSYQKHLELGFAFKNPVIIPNSVDHSIFNTTNRVSLPDGKRKIKLIATSWSDNPNKGLEYYKYLDEHLDLSKFEFTFLGRIHYEFKNCKHILPLPSEDVANYLKEHDIYITASKNEACSNGILEALACGLPVAYLDSGSNSELVKEAGVYFHSTQDFFNSIETIANNYSYYQAKITISSIAEIANQYKKVIFSSNFKQAK